jgi:A/G-specific adenine glycosylase
MWYNHNKRELPWRQTNDAYRIWISEIILQQTQVVTGLQYYLNITDRFPTVTQMALAHQDELLKLWQGMGYYSRARNMYCAAHTIVEKHNGVFPNNYNDIAALKGIGPYTAAAIASIAFNLPYAVVDGNVYRVLSRLYAIDTPIDTTEGKKLFLRLATDLLDHRNPGLHNQALMELGALVCKPANPNCAECVLAAYCLAYSSGTYLSFPVKSKKVNIKNRYLTFIVIIDNHHTYIEQRDGNDIWKGLYQFPLIENPKEHSDEEIVSQSLAIKGLSITNANVKHVDYQKHQLTHQTLHIHFVTIAGQCNKHNYKKLSINDLHQYAFPKPIERFLKKHNIDY